MGTGVTQVADRAARPATLWLLVLVLLFQGISATPPGLLLALDPTGGCMNMPNRAGPPRGCRRRPGTRRP